jgi:quercetin dioxygenase-like cupin family protein
MLEDENSRDYYLNSINELRIERLDKRIEFGNITNNIEEIMRHLNGLGEDNMITINEFKDIKLNELILLSTSVSFVKLFQSDNEMHFTTYLKAGGKYGIHQHDCDEHTTVIKGNLVELLDGIVYNEGETVIYLAGSKHEPSCTIDSEYFVVFKR